jgi:hypothetical protein
MNDKENTPFSINPPTQSTDLPQGATRVPAAPPEAQGPAFENMILDACVAEFQSKKKKAFINLHNYLTNPAAIGEHGDLVSECVTLIKDLSDANGGLEAIRELTRH